MLRTSAAYSYTYSIYNIAARAHQCAPPRAGGGKKISAAAERDRDLFLVTETQRERERQSKSITAVARKKEPVIMGRHRRVISLTAAVEQYWQ